MGFARAAIALVVLVTIAVVVPGIAQARGAGEAPIAAACVDDPELGFEVEVPASVAAPLVRRSVVEVAASTVGARPRSTRLLLRCAPKTSPPGERRSWV